MFNDQTVCNRLCLPLNVIGTSQTKIQQINLKIDKKKSVGNRKLTTNVNKDFEQSCFEAYQIPSADSPPLRWFLNSFRVWTSKVRIIRKTEKNRKLQVSWTFQQCTAMAFQTLPLTIFYVNSEAYRTTLNGILMLNLFPAKLANGVLVTRWAKFDVPSHY